MEKIPNFFWMKTKNLSWNVNGLKGNRKWDIIKSLIRDWKPDILCLQETKIEDWNGILARQFWGNRWVEWAELKASDTRGGIVTMWDKRHWNCIEIQHGIHSISGVYGPHTNLEREEIWHELGAVRGLSDEQWVIGGDFSVCRFESERHNYVRRSRAMRGFTDVIQDLCLVDLPLQGAYFTWWLNTEGFLEKIKIWWQSYDVNGTPDFILVQKLKLLKKDLTIWNREEFGNIAVKRGITLEELSLL
nr:exodeoxyribonuclease-like [Nicotiana tomentosiformis]